MTRRKLSVMFKAYTEVKDFFQKHLDVDDPDIYKLLTVWAMGTHVYNLFDSFPYLYLSGPPESGKSRCLYLFSCLAKDPVFAVNISTAALFRTIENFSPTLLMDEMEDLSKPRMEDTRLIIQGGYKKEHGFVYRTMKKSADEDYEVEKYNVYCPKAIASISLPSAVFESRCILLTLKGTFNKEISDAVIDKEHSVALKKGLQMVMKTKSKKVLETYHHYDHRHLRGRDLELWKPILSLASVIDDQVLLDLEDFAVAWSRSRIEVEKGTLRFAIIQWLLDMIKEPTQTSLSGMFMDLQSDFRDLTPQRLGKTMRVLGFAAKHTSKGALYTFDPYIILNLAKRFRIENTEDDNNAKGL